MFGKADRFSCIDEEDKNRESSHALPDLHTVIFTKFTSTEFDLLLALAEQKSVDKYVWASYSI